MTDHDKDAEIARLTEALEQEREKQRLVEESYATVLEGVKAERDQLKEALEQATREREFNPYCDNCGACGVDGCCPAPKCKYFKEYTGDVGAKLADAVDELRELRKDYYALEAERDQQAGALAGALVTLRAEVQRARRRVAGVINGDGIGLAYEAEDILRAALAASAPASTPEEG
jgi:DNA repair exonuclease SbcCD ATPase subunit